MSGNLLFFARKFEYFYSNILLKYFYSIVLYSAIMVGPKSTSQLLSSMMIVLIIFFLLSFIIPIAPVWVLIIAWYVASKIADKYYFDEKYKPNTAPQPQPAPGE